MLTLWNHTVSCIQLIFLVLNLKTCPDYRIGKPIHPPVSPAGRAEIWAFLLSAQWVVRSLTHDPAEYRQPPYSSALSQAHISALHAAMINNNQNVNRHHSVYTFGTKTYQWGLGNYGSAKVFKLWVVPAVKHPQKCWGDWLFVSP